MTVCVQRVLHVQGLTECHAYCNTPQTQREKSNSIAAFWYNEDCFGWISSRNGSVSKQRGVALQNRMKDNLWKWNTSNDSLDKFPEDGSLSSTARLHCHPKSQQSTETVKKDHVWLNTQTRRQKEAKKGRKGGIWQWVGEAEAANWVATERKSEAPFAKVLLGV